jgi:hypothetical protein
MANQNRLRITLVYNMLMKPIHITFNAGARLAFRMTGEANSFGVGEMFSLIMPY